MLSCTALFVPPPHPQRLPRHQLRPQNSSTRHHPLTWRLGEDPKAGRGSDRAALEALLACCVAACCRAPSTGQVNSPSNDQVIGRCRQDIMIAEMNQHCSKKQPVELTTWCASRLPKLGWRSSEMLRDVLVTSTGRTWKDTAEGSVLAESSNLWAACSGIGD